MDSTIFTASSIVATDLPLMEPMKVPIDGTGAVSQNENENSPGPELSTKDSSPADLLSKAGICPDASVRPLLDATAQLCANWFIAMKEAIGRERSKQMRYREEYGISKKTKVAYVPPTLTLEEAAMAKSSASVIRATFGDKVADYAEKGFDSAISTGDKRSFKIRLVMIKARDSLKGSPLHESFSKWLDLYISKAEQKAGCIPCPGPRRMSKKEKAKKMARMGYDPNQLLLPFPNFYSKEEENILLDGVEKTANKSDKNTTTHPSNQSGTSKQRKSRSPRKKVEDNHSTTSTTTNTTNTTTTDSTSQLPQPTSQQNITTPQLHSSGISANNNNNNQDAIATIEATAEFQDNEADSTPINGKEYSNGEKGKYASLLKDGRMFRSVISTVGSILQKNTIEDLANKAKAECIIENSQNISNAAIVTVTKEENFEKVTVTGKKGRSGGRKNVTVTGTVTLPTSILPRKTKNYENAKEILDDIKGNKINPYHTSAEVLEGMKVGELTPAEAMLYLSIISSVSSVKPTKGSRGRKSKVSEDSLNRLADEIRASEGYEETDEDGEYYGEEQEEEDDEEEDSGDTRSGPRFSCNPRGFAGGYSEGDYAGGGMEWSPDDNW